VTEIDAKIAAKNLAEETERHRSETPALMTDDELRSRFQGMREIQATAERIITGLDNEIVRRMFV
jgi:hypothetical protein